MGAEESKKLTLALVDEEIYLNSMAQPFESLGIHEMAFTQSGDQVDPTVDVPNNSGAYGYAAKRYGRPETLAPVEEETG